MNLLQGGIFPFTRWFKILREIFLGLRLNGLKSVTFPFMAISEMRLEEKSVGYHRSCQIYPPPHEFRPTHSQFYEVTNAAVFLVWQFFYELMNFCPDEPQISKNWTRKYWDSEVVLATFFNFVEIISYSLHHICIKKTMSFLLALSLLSKINFTQMILEEVLTLGRF